MLLRAKQIAKQEEGKENISISRREYLGNQENSHSTENYYPPLDEVLVETGKTTTINIPMTRKRKLPIISNEYLDVKEEEGINNNNNTNKLKDHNDNNNKHVGITQLLTSKYKLSDDQIFLAKKRLSEIFINEIKDIPLFYLLGHDLLHLASDHHHHHNHHNVSIY